MTYVEPVSRCQRDRGCLYGRLLEAEEFCIEYCFSCVSTIVTLSSIIEFYYLCSEKQNRWLIKGKNACAVAELFLKVIIFSLTKIIISVCNSSLSAS